MCCSSHATVRASGSTSAYALSSAFANMNDGLAAFFDLALRRGDATCVIATEDVRDGLGRRLRARGWDVGAPHTHERYLVIDAAEALNRFMRKGLPDADLLGEIAGELDQYRRCVWTVVGRERWAVSHATDV